MHTLVFLSFLILTFFNGSLASAAACDLDPLRDAPELSGRNHQLQTAEGGTLTLIGETPLSAQESAQAEKFLNMHNAPAGQMATLAKEFAATHKEALKIYDQDTAYLHRVLAGQHPPRYIGIEDRPDWSQPTDADALMLQTLQWVQIHKANIADVDWSLVLLAAAGPIQYSHLTQSNLFHNVRLGKLSESVFTTASDEIRSLLAGGGDVIVFVSQGNLEKSSLAMVQLCQKTLHLSTAGTPPQPSKPTPPSPQPSANVTPSVTPVIPKTLPNMPPVANRTRQGRSAPSKAPVTGRRSGVTYTPFTYSWWTTDRNGNKYKHVRPRR